jgi:Stress responsive A/B Barrel Domain
LLYAIFVFASLGVLFLVSLFYETRLSHVFLISFFFQFGYGQFAQQSHGLYHQTVMAPLTHIVIFQYKSDTDEAQKTAIAEAFLALRYQCLSPANFTSPGDPYILNIIAGSNNSSEDPAKGYQVSRLANRFAIILLNIRSVHSMRTS